MKKEYYMLLVFSMILIMFAAILFNDLIVDEEVSKLYQFPILVGEKTYILGVCSNYSSAPKVNYFGLLKSVSVDFKGERENSFCNVTIPIDLIWGELSVYNHGYEMSEDDYIQSSNSTHNSVYFMFDLPALTKDFDIMGTQGVIP